MKERTNVIKRPCSNVFVPGPTIKSSGGEQVDQGEKMSKARIFPLFIFLSGAQAHGNRGGKRGERGRRGDQD